MTGNWCGANDGQDEGERADSEGIMVAIVFFLVTVLVVGPGPEQTDAPLSMTRYLPGENELELWRPKGGSQIFVGENLYELIDGGAEIYYEYGFKQVIVQNYQNPDAKSINLAIYEMDNSSSAYGIYTFQSAEGEEVEVGSEGIRSDYYLQFWKDKFFVTLIASDTEESTSRGLHTIAREVDHRIATHNQRPSLCNLVAIESLTPSRIVYMKGPLALSNIYDFSSDDIFGLREGVVGNYGEFSVFVFKYHSAKESRDRFTNALAKMSANPRFDNFAGHNDEYHMIDKRAAIIQMKVHRNYIFVYTGTDETDPQAIFYQIENNLR